MLPHTPTPTTNPALGATITPLTATIAASGLVEGLALHRAVSHVVSQLPTSVEDHDRRLGERLIETGVLNSWQVDQLRRGRTKFTLGPYQIVDSLARGGMGHVFKARHELLGRIEAVKVLPRTRSTPEAVASFLHEIRSQASLDHPNLVRVSYADREGDVYYLVTEFIPGIDLRRLIRKRGPVDEKIAAWIVSQAATAIDHAHRRGLVHRDVKPGNVLLTPTGGVKVTDLGLAWSLDGLAAAGEVYAEGKIAGTSDYLAPESIRYPDIVRPESDLYGLGCTLYYAVTGKVPFPGGTHADKLRRRLREEPKEPQSLNPSLSPAIVSIILRAMARQPEQRPESAAAMASELLELVDSGARERLAVVVTETIARRQADESAARWSSGEAEDLPETVGLPLHEIAPPFAVEAAVAREASATSDREMSEGELPEVELLEEDSPRLKDRTAPQVITWVALGFTAGLLLLTALRRWFGW
ncbi:serine/threonine-protein kinase [Botrimarina mediterranea]|uniref:Serine/threonine-protein kinase PrkC n=1 Tax=Botrimarina mediterranea TaxID=2528022 RepID=A0A518K9V8_9BACT|nr:serine/threonine-protein kinase [Botrimarina mediterranea]QDV74572.1 Serine/threonine-protein kinase PrkC [Botrimarina mediterranea]